MNFEQFVTRSRVLVVAGKGGVGKTTVTGALALAAARSGLSVLIVELEGKSGLRESFGGVGPLGYGEERLWPGQPDSPGELGAKDEPRSGGVGDDAGSRKGEVRARRITPDDALLEYLSDHGLKRISKRLVSSGALEVVSTAIPGIRDILVLGKVKQLERRVAADLILVDAPATGHAVTFLTSANGLLEAARSGPVRSQAQEVVELLSDGDRCRILLVTLPEEMPVNEIIDAAYLLEDKVGVSLGPLVVNSCLEELPGGPVDASPDGRSASIARFMAGVIDEENLPRRPLKKLSASVAQAALEAGAFQEHRRALQVEQCGRLKEELPLPQLRIPLLFDDQIRIAELAILATALTRAVSELH